MTLFTIDQKGLTLIEVLIVVVIIAILAAIAIPQFAMYRMRGYNAAANSDMRNGCTAEEAIITDSGGYGMTAQAMFPGPGGTGVGSVLSGPLPVGTVASVGGVITTGPTALGRPIVGMGISVSNNVSLRGDTMSFIGPFTGYGSSYLLVSKHTFGDSAFAHEAEITASFLCRSSAAAWVNVTGLAMVTIPEVTPGSNLISTTGTPVACGGTEIPDWITF